MERPTTATTVEPRQRILKACASCSARKTKCDGREGGCSSCAKLGLECVYVSSGKKRGPPKGSPARGGPPRKNKAPILAPSSSSASVSSLFDQLDAKPWASVGGGATTSMSPPSSSSTSYSLQQQQQQQPQPQPQPHLQSHSQSQSLLQPQQQQLQSQLSLPAGAIEALLLVYETFIHPHWPVVYLPALGSLRILEQRSPLLFDAILTISAANSSDPSMMRLSDGMVEAVRRRILDCLTDAATLNRIEVIQSMILISLVDLGSGRSSMAYQFGGMACRMALDMNLHVQTAPPKDKSRRRRGLDERSAPGRGSSSSSSSLRDGGSSSSSSNHQTTSSSQEARRTMWACYVLDKVLAAVLQRPPAMRQQDIDVDKPSTMERDEVDLPWRAEGLARVRFLHPQAYGAMEHLRSHALSSFSAWCDVMAILERILDDVYRPRSRRRRHHHHHHQHHQRQHQSFHGHGHDQHQHPLGHDEPPRDDEAAVARLDDELRRWRRGLPDHLQWGDDGAAEEHVDVGLQVLTLRGWYYTCVLLLHRPRLPLSLDESCSDLEAIDALQQLRGATRSSGSSGGSNHLQRDPASSHRMASPVTGATEAATSICVIMEAYEATFKVLKFPASWVYLIFQAATVHAGLAAAGNAASQEARRRLQQCIAWLEQISQTWRSASHHVETLNRLLAVGARTRTRPPSPDVAAPTYVGVIDPLLATAATANANAPTPPSAAAGTAGADDGAASWNLFWSSMPTTSEDASLWQGFSDLFPQQQQHTPQQPPPPPQPQRQQPPLQIVS